MSLASKQKAFQDDGHFQKRAGAHFVGIFFEAEFPVGMVVAFAVDQKGDDFHHFTVFDHGTQADHANIVERDFHFQAAGLDFEKIEFMDVRAYCAAADLFNYPDTMVRINYFVTDCEVQLTIHSTPRWDILRGNSRQKTL